MKMMVLTLANAAGMREGRVSVNPNNVDYVKPLRTGCLIVFDNKQIEVAQSADHVTMLMEKDQ
mgnify:CR=1 FL=1